MISAVVFGYLGRDAEVRATAGGQTILSFSVASNSRVKKDGEWVNATDWINVTMFGDRGVKLAPHLTKGKPVVVRGTIAMREYKKKDGTHGVSLELKADDIEFSGKSQDSKSADRPASPPARPHAPASATDYDDEIPF